MISFIKKEKRQIPFILILLTIFTFPRYIPFTQANNSSPGSIYTANCASCHGGGDFIPTVMLTSFPAEYTPGQTYSITIQVGGGTKQGFRLNASAGTFSSGVGSSASGPNIVHSAGVVSNPASWTFNWTAPPAGNGNVTFTGYGNATNNNGTPSGDNATSGAVGTSVETIPPTSSSNVKFSGVTVDSLTATWNLISGNSYVMVLSQLFDFSSILSSGTGTINQNTTTYTSLSPNTVYFFKVKISTHSDAFYSAAISTKTLSPSATVIISTGGTISAGATTLTADAGVSITHSILSDGSTRQTFLSTQNANVIYGNGFTLQLPANIQAAAVATSNNVTLTSTQTVPIIESGSGTLIEATSGSLSVQTSENSLTIQLGTNAVQNVQTTLPTGITKTVSISLNPTSGERKVDWPPNAFSETVKARVKIPDFLPSDESAVGKIKSVGNGIEIILDKTVQPAQTVPITISFRDSDITGSELTSLICSRFDETSQQWTLLPSTVDSVSKRVIGRTQHLSKFQIVSVLPASSISNAKVFPNPFQSSKGHTEIKFTNIPEGTRIKIYTIVGQLVKELFADSTGRASWDVKNSSGKEVASDIYLAMIEGTGGKKILKVGVQR